MIRTLRIFCDLIRMGSFTAAAERNYLTQSAVSQHLKTLEQKLGHRLVERGRHRISPTRAGLLVLQAGQDIIRRYDQLELSLKRPPADIAGRLRVGSVYTAGLYTLPPYTTAYLKLYPKVDLLLSYLKDAEIYEALLSGKIELGIVDHPKPRPQLRITPFRKDRVVLIVPPRHAWASRKQVRLAQLSGQPFIVPQAEMPVDEILKKTAVRVKVVHAFDNIEITKRAVEVGLGLALVPSIAVKEEVRTGRLHALDLAEGPFERTIGIVTRKEVELSLAAQKFVDLLLAPATPPAGARR